MGLREKVALATVTVITAQIICSHCMPRGLPNCSIKSHICSLISPKSDSIREIKTNRKLKNNFYKNIITGNNSKVLPNVEDPLEFETGGYYRFFCDYPQDTNKFLKTLPQTRNYKREANQNRYLGMNPRDKAKLPITSSGLTLDPPPQPYCFRKSNFFPEVEYPLSARDMWIPNYWSRLLDAEVPRNVKTDAPINQNKQENTKSMFSNYENSPLYDIIKTLNSHNKADINGNDPNNFQEPVPEKSEAESIHNDESFNRNLNTSTTTVLPENTPLSAPDIHSEILPYTPTTKEAYSILETTKASSIAPSVTNATTMATAEKTLFTPPYTTTPMIPNIPTIISSLPSSDLRNSDFNDIGVTATLSFEHSTSPIQTIESADNFISHVNIEDIPTTVSTKVPLMQGQERETSMSDTNTEPTTASPLVSFISPTEKKPKQELRDHTKQMPSTAMLSVSGISPDMIHSDFDIIDLITASPLDLLTSPMTHSEALSDNSSSHNQAEIISTTLSTTATSTKHQEGELSLMETNTRPTTASPLLSFSSTIENKPELRDYTTPMQSTSNSKLYSNDEVPIPNLPAEKIFSGNNTLVLSNTLQENSNDFDTNKSLLKHEVLKNDVEVRQPSIPSSPVLTTSHYSSQPKDMSLAADQRLPENQIQLDNFQRQVMEDFFGNSSNYDILQLGTNDDRNVSIIFMDDCKENWVFNPNDSYITCESIPEYPDECFIFVDTENTSSSKAIHTDNNFNVTTKAEQSLIADSNRSGDAVKNVTSIPESYRHTVPMNKNKSGETPKKMLSNVPKSNLFDITANTEVESLQSTQEPETAKYPVDNGLRVLDNIGNTADTTSNANCTMLKLPSILENLNDSCFIAYDIGNTTTNENVDETQAIVNYLMQESYIDENTFSASNYTISDLILYVEDMNSSSENVYVDGDETWASYTEIPYDSLVLYPEDLNYTWTANGNDYVIFQQILPKDSDDTTFLFLDTDNTAGLFNDLIVNTN